MTDTYYKAFAPRIGLAYSPGSSGKTSIRMGYGMFYNPMEQLVLEQFQAEPPFGVSTTVSEGFLDTPWALQSCGDSGLPCAVGGTGVIPNNSGSILRSCSRNSAGLVAIPTHDSLRRTAAQNSAAIRGTVQLHDPAPAQSRHGFPGGVCGNARSSPAGHARSELTAIRKPVSIWKRWPRITPEMAAPVIPVSARIADRSLPTRHSPFPTRPMTLAAVWSMWSRRLAACTFLMVPTAPR